MHGSLVAAALPVRQDRTGRLRARRFVRQDRTGRLRVRRFGCRPHWWGRYLERREQSPRLPQIEDRESKRAAPYLTLALGDGHMAAGGVHRELDAGPPRQVVV